VVEVAPPVVEDVRRVTAMTRALAHRGPDGSGVLDAGGGVVLGHRRLSILDTGPSAAQPMRNETGTLALTYNGEIYNYVTLRAELAARGVQVQSTGDTEVLLRCLETWGEDALPRIDGMFAFAAFDSRGHRLLLARDRLGKKPLFIHRRRGALFFASELSGLHAGGVSLEPDRDVLPDFLVRGYVPVPRTNCRDIEQLAPGELLIVDERGAEQRRRYWAHPHLRQGPPPRQEKDEQRAVETIRSLFRSAVERRLASDVPLGAFLSGGVDSAAVVALAQQRLSRPMSTFTIGFEGAPDWDETAAARDTARLLGTRHTERIVRPDALDIQSLVVARTGEPQGDSSLVPTYLVSRLAREQVTVALSGDGGDELFAGYERFLLAYAAAWVAPLSGLVPGALLASPREGAQGGGLARRLKRWARAVSFGPAATLMEWAGGTRVIDAQNLLGRALDPHALAAPERSAYATARVRGAGRLHALLAANIDTYLGGDILPKVDRASMATSLEVRSPLLDTQLIEYAASLAPWLLARGRRLKWIFKRAMADLLPEQILHRRKRGFGAPVAAWFRGEPGRRLAQRLLAREARLPALIDRARIQSLLDAHIGGREDHGIMLWRLLALEEWLGTLAAWRTAAPSLSEVA
jgi:asparagine synthase (glutamine-hydrolysing)